MALPITIVSACILAILFVILSMRVIQGRGQNNVNLGDGGNETLTRRIRGHGNLAEYAPFGIVLILVAELSSVNTLLLAVFAIIFVAGRISHAYALSFTDNSPRSRIAGMMLTLTGLLLLIGLNLISLVV